MFRRLLHIFFNFREFCEYHVGKNLPLLLQTIHRAIFSHFRTNQSAAQQVRDSSMQTRGIRKEPSLVSKSHGVELPSGVLPMCREVILLNVMENFHKEKWLCVASTDILAFFQAERLKSVNCC